MEKFDQLMKQAKEAADAGNHKQAIDLLTEAILLKPNNALALFNRGYSYGEIGENQKAIEDYTEVIRLKPNEAMAFNNRGIAYRNIGEHKKAIEDYTETIRLKPDYTPALFNRGYSHGETGEHQKAIEDYTEVARLNPNEASAFNNRGVAYDGIGENQKAIADYTEAIRLKSDFALALSNRGNSYGKIGEHQKALDDYILAEKLGRDVSYAISQTRKAIKDAFEAVVISITTQITTLLRFTEGTITHYTSMETARILLLQDKSKFQLSNAAHLNDPTEGTVLLDYLTEDDPGGSSKGNTEVTYSHAPFIGSFVSDSNDLTLWRMYGKENHTEAAGCAISFDPAFLLSPLTEQSEDNSPQSSQSVPLYRVVYRDKDGFHAIGVADVKLNELFIKLKDVVKGRLRTELTAIDALNELRYLIKLAHYRHENECRIVKPTVPGSQTIKTDCTATPPRIYIEIEADHLPHIKEVIIGPKAEQATEWAAAFKVRFSQLNKDKDVPIKISTLPFK